MTDFSTALLFIIHLSSLAAFSRGQPLPVTAAPGDIVSLTPCTSSLVTRDGETLNTTSNPRYDQSDDDNAFYIINVTYSDMGEYSCQSDEQFILSLVPAYSPLVRVGSQGQSSVLTSDNVKISCPVVGVPGPSVIYWKRGQTENSPDVTATMENATRGPFVDSDGALDFSLATNVDTGHYRCTAVDELGATVRHTFYVEVNDNFIVLWREWYIILVYCVGAVVILALLVVFAWFCFSVRFILWRRVRKVVRKREVVTRPKSFDRAQSRDTYLMDGEEKFGY